MAQLAEVEEEVITIIKNLKYFCKPIFNNKLYTKKVSSNNKFIYVLKNIILKLCLYIKSILLWQNNNRFVKHNNSFKFVLFINIIIKFLTIRKMYVLPTEVFPYTNFFFQVPEDKPIISSGKTSKTPKHKQATQIFPQNRPKTSIKIGSVNICGGLEHKVKYIINMLKKKKYDILALVETHTFKSDQSWLNTAFDGYAAFCEGDNKTSVFKNYRLEKKKKSF